MQIGMNIAYIAEWFNIMKKVNFHLYLLVMLI